MVSRKRSKGKERKAKKEEKRREEGVVRGGNNNNYLSMAQIRWRRWARGCKDDDPMGMKRSIHCNHGCDLAILDNPSHPVCGFLNDYFVSANWLKTVMDYEKVWDNSCHRNSAIDILTRIGTNLLLGHNMNTDAGAVLAACAIKVLEHYNENMLDIESTVFIHDVSTKLRDLQICMHTSCQMRDVLKFYSKRLSCSCLKKMHSDARKTMPKQGFCHHCQVVKDRALLSVCSRCRISQYCSRECQVAAWPEHEATCDAYFVRNYVGKVA